MTDEKRMLTVGSLFSGIGGFDLGLERAGMRVIWQSEIDPYASAVLRKHWPGVPNHGDIRGITRGNVERPDVLCGGFPCQDISNAGKRAGIGGERSGLWSEYARVIGELRPRFVLVENVAALLGRGLERVLGDLAALGYSCVWHCIPASAVGAPHRRDRVWIVAYADSGRRSGRRSGMGLRPQQPGRSEVFSTSEIRQGSDVADADFQRLAERIMLAGVSGRAGCGDERQNVAVGSWWITEPDVGGSIDGLPGWLHRFVGWGMTYAESERSVEALRQLWSADVSHALWQAIGGLGRFQQAQVLFAFVRQHEADPDQARLLLASEEAFTDFVRGVWGAASTSRAPRRSKQGEQRASEHPDVVQVVSQLFARNGEAAWGGGGWEDGIPRVAHGIPQRVDRLRCLGNAIVPQVAEIIGRAVMEAA